VFLLILSACAPSTNYIVRFDFNEDDINSLYKNMPEKEVVELLGLPQKSNTYIDTSSYDYVSESGILRVELSYKKLEKATFYEVDHATDIQLPEKKVTQIDSTKYLRKINYNISADESGFINNGTDSEEIQTNLGPPHYISAYDVNGFYVNAFVYNLKDGNMLYIVYKQNGLVGIAQIQNKAGETVKDIVQLDE
jgi:outer membrane protein assembly factor BamE (lipoprotein component of BamABCDE complex)